MGANFPFCTSFRIVVSVTAMLSKIHFLILEPKERAFRFRQGENYREVFDIIRKKWVAWTMEEMVRQHIIHFLVEDWKISKSKFQIEGSIINAEKKFRFDIMITSHNNPCLLLECKSPEISIDSKAIDQLLNYQSLLKSRFIGWSNGQQTAIYDTQTISWISSWQILVEEITKK